MRQGWWFFYGPESHALAHARRGTHFEVADTLNELGNVASMQDHYPEAKRQTRMAAEEACRYSGSLQQRRI